MTVQGIDTVAGLSQFRTKLSAHQTASICLDAQSHLSTCSLSPILICSFYHASAQLFLRLVCLLVDSDSCMNEVVPCRIYLLHSERLTTLAFLLALLRTDIFPLLLSIPVAFQGAHSSQEPQ